MYLYTLIYLSPIFFLRKCFLTNTIRLFYYHNFFKPLIKRFYLKFQDWQLKSYIFKKPNINTLAKTTFLTKKNTNNKIGIIIATIYYKYKTKLTETFVTSQKTEDKTDKSIVSLINLTYLLIFTFTFIGCSNPKDKKIEENLRFEIQEYDIIDNIKYSANIILERRLTEKELIDLADYIYRNENIRKYQRGFLSYYLPNMKIGNGAWATTHYNLNLKVIIFGLKVEEENFLNNNKLQPKNNQEIIGQWLDNLSLSLISIYKENNKLMERRLSLDGNIALYKIKRKGLSFFNSKRYKRGEYYKLSKNGILSLYDKKGLIYSYEKVLSLKLYSGH